MEMNIDNGSNSGMWKFIPELIQIDSLSKAICHLCGSTRLNPKSFGCKEISVTSSEISRSHLELETFHPTHSGVILLGMDFA